MKRKFRTEITPSGKIIYIDIEIDKKRLSIMRDFSKGKISITEFKQIQNDIRNNPKKWKHLYSYLPEDAELV